jgi:hypothetical protein
MQRPSIRRLFGSSLVAAACFLTSESIADPLNPGNYATLGSLAPATGSLVFNTDTLTVSGAFNGTGVVQQQAPGLPGIAVFTFSNINLPAGVSIDVVGSRPIALLSQGNAVIGANIFLSSSQRNFQFEQSGVAGGGAGGTIPLGAGSGPGGGGYNQNTGQGGGFGGQGGLGFGLGPIVNGTGSPYGNLLQALQGGSGGGGAAPTAAGLFAAGGAGGSAIEIGAAGTVNIGGRIVAAGYNGGVNVPSNASGGGGSGGGVLLHGASVTGSAASGINVSGGNGGPDGALSWSGGGGGGGRVAIVVDAYTLGASAPLPSANVQGGLNGGNPLYGGSPQQSGAAGTANFLPTWTTVVAGGGPTQVAADGTLTRSVGDYTLQTRNLQVNTGATITTAGPVTSSYDIRLQGGQVAGQGWTATGTAQISGSGAIRGSFAGGAATSILTSGGGIVIGDNNSATTISFDGSATVATDSALMFVSPNTVTLRGATVLANDSQLTATNGLLLANGATLTATGNAVVEGAVTNRGSVGGPTGAGRFLTFLSGVNGDGNYSGNTRFQTSFAPGNSPALVTFAGNASFAADARLEMELGGLAPGAGHDKIVVTGLLDIGGARLEVLYWDGFFASAGDVFDLFDWGSLSGTFGSVALPTLVDGLVWNMQLYIDGTISVSGVTPVPEPGTYALMLAGLGLLGAATRRRRANV